MSIPNKIGKITLLPNQIESIDKWKEKPFDLSDAGVGKTYSALGAYLQSGCSKLLVICLAPKVADFAEDGALMNIEITPLNRGTKKNKELLGESDKVAISFESVWRITELLKWVDKDTFIIIDEAHKVGVTSSKVTKFVMKLTKKTKYVRLLTATPVSNGKLENYYPLLYMINVFRKPKKEFEELFVIKQMRQMGSLRFMQIVGYQNEHLLNDMINSVAVRFTRDKDYFPEDYVLKTKKPAMYAKLKKHRMYKADNGEVIELDNSSKLFNAMRCVSHGFLLGINKQVSKEPFERLQAILETHNNERIVIFYNYNVELEMLKQVLDKLKRPYSQYNGASKDLKAFKGKDNGVVLAHYKSASTGINDFVIANVTIYNSMPLESINYEQSKARTDRYGQTKKPLYYHIVPETPTEKKIFETVTNGKDFTNEMIEEILK
ncbi:SNF2-related protein [Enterococcus faecalis]|uniref:SNF2-related protein n=1 Tax=Enterococcus faecalis TaxID=1351 RepID=UPI001F05E469|nr:SNF2-related protein [Enterococcus faecalis]MCH1677422.1 SNF2-related protein [Enterococcus faecalis]MCH1680214.1 SNF2-related protein [Enterococcus faecalis]